MATEADVGMGKLLIIVPADVTVKLSIDVGVGDIQLPGDDEKDVDVAPGKHKEVTLAPTAKRHGHRHAGPRSQGRHRTGGGEPCCVMSSSREGWSPGPS